MQNRENLIIIMHTLTEVHLYISLQPEMGEIEKVYIEILIKKYPINII